MASRWAVQQYGSGAILVLNSHVRPRVLLVLLRFRMSFYLQLVVADVICEGIARQSGGGVITNEA